jgi:hypothetical protein
MKKTALIMLALLATSSLALAQGSGGSGTSSGSGTAGGSPGSVPSGTGGIGTAPRGGVGVPGGTGPGDLTVRPNIPDMRPGSSTVGRELDGNARSTSPSRPGLTSRPSSLDAPTLRPPGRIPRSAAGIRPPRRRVRRASWCRSGDDKREGRLRSAALPVGSDPSADHIHHAVLVRIDQDHSPRTRRGSRLEIVVAAR